MGIEKRRRFAMARRWPAMALMVVMAVAGVVSAMPDVVSMEAEDGGLQDGAAHAQIEDLRQRSEDAAASLRALKMERKHRLTIIRAQRAAEMKRLKKQHAVELAAERQQAKYEWHDLMSQHRTELQKLKAKVAIQQRVTARVTRTQAPGWARVKMRADSPRSSCRCTRTASS